MNEAFLRPDEIEEYIQRIVALYRDYQVNDRGFKTFVTRPETNANNNWIEDMRNTFVPANILLPLTLLDTPEARKIITTEFAYLSHYRNAFGLWRYFEDTDAPYFIPYETDTNSLLSYISVYLDEKPVAKYYFNQQITESGYVNLWFLPDVKFFFTNPFYYCNLLRSRNKAKKFLAFKNKVIDRDDAEFCVTANVLLYMGNSNQTKNMIFRLVEDMRSSKSIKLTYYPFSIIAYYLFARAYYYGQITAFEKVKSILTEKVKSAYYKEIKYSKHLTILAANIFLFFNIRNSFSEKIIAECCGLYKNIEEPLPFYCSNKNLDIDSVTGLPNAFFGSKDLTVSFYLEFLVLLKKNSYKPEV